MKRSQEIATLIMVKKQAYGYLLQKYAQPIQAMQNLKSQIAELRVELRRIKDGELTDSEIKL